MKDRKKIQKKYKWNLEDIYKSWKDWEKDIDLLQSMMNDIQKYKNKLSKSAKTFINFKKEMEKISILLEKIYLYPYLLKDLDSTDEETSVRMQKIENIYMNFSISMSWVDPEILSIPKEKMISWIEKNKNLKEYEFNLMELYRLQEHILSDDKEKLISYFGQYMGIPSDLYGELSISDIKWNSIKLSTGEKVEVSNGVYSRILSTNRNQNDRKKAFQALYKSYDNTKNTFAAIYRSILYRNIASAKARNFKSVLSMFLENKNIPESVFLSLIESASNNTEPLRRYINLRKKYLKLKEYHYYDNSINILEYDKKFDYEEAKKIVLNSVSVLGKDYSDKMNRALSDGWLDVFETKNKRSGAYSINIYDIHPYMLLNYQETLDDVFTLAHELGHTMHTILSNENQPYETSDYTIFVAEVASTFNERLLLDYMLENSNDSYEKIALLEQSLGNFVGTYYIQSLFANYEYLAHSMVERGESITPDILSSIMFDLFKKYFGDTVKIDELQKIIWARIPHFYNSPFYVYQYATSFSASSKLYSNIKKDKKNIEKYLNLLKSGGNDHPMNQLKKAGVDLSKKSSFDVIGEEFSKLLDIFENELNKITK